MKHYFSTRVRVVLIVAILLAAVIGTVSGLTGRSIPELFVQGVLTPIRTGASKLTEKAGQLYGYIFSYESILAENEELKAKLAALEDDARKADAVSRENDRLRALLDLTGSYEDYKLVDGYIISRSSGDWSNTFTINRGTNAGIREGMCAITQSGELVGLVSQVGPNFAEIKSVLDSSLEISATIASSGFNGMVKGAYSSGLAGLLRMNYLPSSAVIRNNDQIVTSGSTVYPRNLILGYVVDAGFDDTGVAKFALLEPAADLGSLEQVFIVTEFNAG